MLTSEVESLQSRIDTARKREREARAEAARLRRELAAADRRRETQRLCVLGRAWESWGERNSSFRDQAIQFLSGYVVRDTDRYALAGSAWEVPEMIAHTETSTAGNHHEAGDHA